MLRSKVLLKFGYKFDDKCIPEGQYCYEPDFEKNKNSKEWGVYYIIPCKYYKQISRNWNGCMFCGIITDDEVFDDQCKLCGKNYGNLE